MGIMCTGNAGLVNCSRGTNSASCAQDAASHTQLLPSLNCGKGGGWEVDWEGGGGGWPFCLHYAIMQTRNGA